MLSLPGWGPLHILRSIQYVTLEPNKFMCNFCILFVVVVVVVVCVCVCVCACACECVFSILALYGSEIPKCQT